MHKIHIVRCRTTAQTIEAWIQIETGTGHDPARNLCIFIDYSQMCQIVYLAWLCIPNFLSFKSCDDYQRYSISIINCDTSY